MNKQTKNLIEKSMKIKSQCVFVLKMMMPPAQNNNNHCYILEFSSITFNYMSFLIIFIINENKVYIHMIWYLFVCYFLVETLSF